MRFPCAYLECDIATASNQLEWQILAAALFVIAYNKSKNG